MISVLISRILSDCSLKQRELAELLGVPLQRVKRLARDEVKAFASEEIDALATKLRIRPDWVLSGGQGEMFLTQREHAQRMAAHAIPPELQRAVRSVREQMPTWPDGEPPRSKAEAELLANWRACSKKDRETVSDLAARLAKP